jgi:hypothetical protein
LRREIMMNPLLEFTALAITRFEVPLLDMKDRAWLDLDIVNSAGPPVTSVNLAS